MKSICAWCREELARGDSKESSENMISHGICENCKDNLVFQIGVELGVFQRW